MNRKINLLLKIETCCCLSLSHSLVDVCFILIKSTQITSPKQGLVSRTKWGTKMKNLMKKGVRERESGKVTCDMISILLVTLIFNSSLTGCFNYPHFTITWSDTQQSDTKPTLKYFQSNYAHVIYLRWWKEETQNKNGHVNGQHEVTDWILVRCPLELTFFTVPWLLYPCQITLCVNAFSMHSSLSYCSNWFGVSQTRVFDWNNWSFSREKTDGEKCITPHAKNGLSKVQFSRK